MSQEWFPASATCGGACCCYCGIFWRRDSGTRLEQLIHAPAFDGHEQRRLRLASAATPTPATPATTAGIRCCAADDSVPAAAAAAAANAAILPATAAIIHERQWHAHTASSDDGP